MRKFFAQLRPLERRLAVSVLVVLILVLNLCLSGRIFRIGTSCTGAWRIPAKN